MFSPRIKRGIFWLEALNSLGTTWYFYFIFFFLKRQFSFDDRKNLLWAAALGGVFAVSAIVGGRIGQRLGYFKALGFGFATMAAALLVGSVLQNEYAHLAVMLVAAFGMCFTWPNLEAFVAEGETPARLQRNLGINNLIWSGGNAVGYFTGGALLEYFGPRSIFVLPAAIHIVQLIWLVRIQATAREQHPVTEDSRHPTHLVSAGERKRSPVPPAVFMKMSWVANPFAYVAINTAVPLIPFLAGRLHLTPTVAGIVCSIWFFARTIAFGILWKWDGWHYRYRFLAIAYVAMILGFGGIVTADTIAQVLIAQIVFGAGLGLIYYSSLFYSMDVGDTKGEHGGFHEGAIGAGLFVGPAIAVLAMWLWPESEFAGVAAVGAVLLVGFGWLLKLRW